MRKDKKVLEKRLRDKVATRQKNHALIARPSASVSVKPGDVVGGDYFQYPRAEQQRGV